MTLKQLNDFVKYEVVRRIGNYNMLMDYKLAAEAAQLSIHDYQNVMSNYESYYREVINSSFTLFEVIVDNEDAVQFKLNWSTDDLKLKYFTFDEIVDLIIDYQNNGYVDKKLVVVQLPTLDDVYDLK